MLSLSFPVSFLHHQLTLLLIQRESFKFMKHLIQLERGILNQPARRLSSNQLLFISPLTFLSPSPNALSRVPVRKEKHRRNSPKFSSEVPSILPFSRNIFISWINILFTFLISHWTRFYLLFFWSPRFPSRVLVLLFSQNIFCFVLFSQFFSPSKDLKSFRKIERSVGKLR